jgi:hypothetical protein
MRWKLLRRRFSIGAVRMHRELGSTHGREKKPALKLASSNAG